MPLSSTMNPLEEENNLSCGANEAEHHYKGLDMERDVPNAEYHDFAKIQEGGICPKCGKKTVKISRGIEVGNIFQLGTKYTKSMNMTYVDANGESKTPIMGCYGIGVEPYRNIRYARHITMSTARSGRKLSLRGRYTSVQSASMTRKSEHMRTSCTRICRMQASK